MENMEKNYIVDPETGAVTFFDEGDGIFETGVNLVRERTPSQKLRKMIWVYKVKGELRGKIREADMVPKSKDDIGGFEKLDDVFNGSDSMPLYEVRSSFEGKNGKLVKNVHYMVKDVDEFGIELVALVKPKKDSDQGTLDYLIARARKLKEMELEKASVTVDGGDETPETPPAETPGKKNKS